jgi:hypothetical protein
MEQVVLVTAVFGLAFAGMAIGVIVQGRGKELKGSCGGVGTGLGGGTDPDCCMTCPEKDQCDDARDSAELAAVAGKRTGDHPALAQAPASDSGRPVASTHG